MTVRSIVVAFLAAGTIVAGLAIPRQVWAQEAFGTANNVEDRGQEPSTTPAPGPRRVTAATWEESDAPPPGYHVEQSVRRNLIVKGAGLLVLSYTFSAAAGAGSRQTRALLVPVAGPLFVIPQAHSSPGDFVHLDGLATALLIIDFVAQAAGTGMTIYGIAAPESRLVRNTSGLQISPVPVVFPRGGGGFGVQAIF